MTLRWRFFDLFFISLSLSSARGPFICLGPSARMDHVRRQKESYRADGCTNRLLKVSYHAAGGVSLNAELKYNPHILMFESLSYCPSGHLGTVKGQKSIGSNAGALIFTVLSYHAGASPRKNDH